LLKIVSLCVDVKKTVQSRLCETYTFAPTLTNIYRGNHITIVITSLGKTIYKQWTALSL